MIQIVKFVNLANHTTTGSTEKRITEDTICYSWIRLAILFSVTTQCWQFASPKLFAHSSEHQTTLPLMDIWNNLNFCKTHKSVSNRRRLQHCHPLRGNDSDFWLHSKGRKEARKCYVNFLFPVSPYTNTYARSFHVGGSSCERALPSSEGRKEVFCTAYAGFFFVGHSEYRNMFYSSDSLL